MPKQKFKVFLGRIRPVGLVDDSTVEHLVRDRAKVRIAEGESAGAVISMITGYAKAILKNKMVTLMVGGILVILYAYLYILLQLEDYALLMGSIGLFVVLSVIMYLTRKIDWYASPQEIRKSNPAQPLEAPAR